MSLSSSNNPPTELSSTAAEPNQPEQQTAFAAEEDSIDASQSGRPAAIVGAVEDPDKLIEVILHNT